MNIAGSTENVSRNYQRHGARSAIADRLASLDWERIAADLDEYGCATAGMLLEPDACDEFIAMYENRERFRGRIVMASHGFGRGEYKYFAHPLPGAIVNLREALYTPLATIANRWNASLGIDERYPEKHRAFIDRCHRAGQNRPTPLLLRYVEGDYNRLHQDLYGAVAFPLQAAVMLSAPGRDFTGGEFLMVEQRPRMQSRAEVVQLGRGDGVIFATHQRPMRGAHGVYRVNLRHGMSRVRSGHRMMLGIIFHDAL